MLTANCQHIHINNKLNHFDISLNRNTQFPNINQDLRLVYDSHGAKAECIYQIV